MAINKSYTDLEQSKKLARILPIENADMYYHYDNDFGELESIPTITEEDDHFILFPEDVRCWSLSALLEQLPYEVCDDDGNSSYLKIDKWGDLYQLVYIDPYGDFESIETDRYEHFVDACYEMVLKLHELNLL